MKQQREVQLCGRAECWLIHPGIPLGVRDAGTEPFQGFCTQAWPTCRQHRSPGQKLVSFVRSIKFQLTWPRPGDGVASRRVASVLAASSTVRWACNWSRSRRRNWEEWAACHFGHVSRRLKKTSRRDATRSLDHSENANKMRLFLRLTE